MIDFGLDVLDELQKNQEEGILVPVYKPGTEDVLLTIRVAGPDSPQQERARVRQEEEYSARGSQTPLTREENKQVGDRYLARCIMGWEFTRGDGHDVSFAEDTAYELLKRYAYIRQIVDLAAGNRLRFTKRSQTA